MNEIKTPGRLRKVLGVLMRFWWIGYLAVLIAAAAWYGLCRLENVDFVCTNGDYQNYNAFRRVLAGQIPYKDFTNYLGMGPILLCVPLLALHNSFAGSLFVTNFVAAACFILLVSLMFYLITGNKPLSALAGLLLPKLISSSVTMRIPVYGYYTTYYLSSLATPGNSFRPARMFWPTLLCLLALLWMVYTRRKKPGATLRGQAATAKGVAVLGFVIGLGVTWSNDFGFACIGSATLVLLILTIADWVQSKKLSAGAADRLLFRRFLVYFPALALGMLCSALLASRGHLKSYLDFTSGTAGWQFWYFGYYENEKIYSLTDLLQWEKYSRLLIHLGIYLAAMGVCLYRLCRKKEDDRLILFVFLFTAFLAGQFVYIIGSGGNNFDEGVNGLTILLFWALVCKGLLWAAHRLQWMPLVRWGAVGLAACYGVFALYTDAAQLRRLQRLDLKSDSNYVVQMEGVTQDAGALRDMEQIVGDQVLFSTYATALDDMLNVYQPTGSDYIIHALGEEGSARYVQNFVGGKFPLVQTTNFHTWPWENWTVCASWDFYRVLFSNYNVRSDHGVWTLWEYAGDAANVLAAEAAVQILPLDEQKTQIRVTVDTDQPCYVDVTVSWQNNYEMNLQRLQTWHNAVFIPYDERLQALRPGAGDGYFRPAVGEQQHLMVYVENGEGSIVLSGQPAECTQLTVTQAEAGDVIRFQR